MGSSLDIDTFINNIEEELAYSVREEKGGVLHILAELQTDEEKETPEQYWGGDLKFKELLQVETDSGIFFITDKFSIGEVEHVSTIQVKRRRIKEGDKYFINCRVYVNTIKKQN